MHYHYPALVRFFFGIVGIISVLGVTSVAQADWTPPIGIPMPPFGIVEVAPKPPSSWTTDIPGFYYVKEGGTNSGNGSPSNPRGRIPSTLPAGSVVVLGGTYTVNHEDDVITANGTASRPVYIGGCCGNTPTITSKWVVSGSYYIIENLNGRWTNASGNGKLVFSGDHAVVRHTDLQGDKGTGVGGLYPGGSNLVIWDNFVHDSGDVNANYDQDNHCIPVGDHTDHLWIVDNELARCSGDGVQINAGSKGDQATTHHIYVGRNISHDHKQTGMWTKQAVDVIFSQNTIYGARPGNSDFGACTGFQYAPDYVWFLFNNLSNCEGGIAFASNSGLGFGTEAFIIGNLIHNIHHTDPGWDPSNSWAPAAIMLWGGVNRYLINNTIWDVDAGIYSPGAGKTDIEDNIIGGRTQNAGRDIFIEDSSNAGSSTVKNNLFDSAKILIQWNGSTQYNSLASFQSATGKGQNNLQANPLFVGAATGDFHLQTGSPAINVGVTHSVYTTFLTRYGIDIAKDIERTPRPQGVSYDLGAYEYTSQVVLQPPVAPRGLEVR